jgi:hypothetical protein
MMMMTTVMLTIIIIIIIHVRNIESSEELLCWPCSLMLIPFLYFNKFQMDGPGLCNMGTSRNY